MGFDIDDDEYRFFLLFLILCFRDRNNDKNGRRRTDDGENNLFRAVLVAILTIGRPSFVQPNFHSKSGVSKSFSTPRNAFPS